LGVHMSWATTFCRVAPGIYGSSARNLFHFTLLASRIWRWLLHIWKMFCYYYYYYFLLQLLYWVYGL
jgi:hypothetical protein